MEMIPLPFLWPKLDFNWPTAIIMSLWEGHLLSTVGDSGKVDANPNVDMLYSFEMLLLSLLAQKYELDYWLAKPIVGVGLGFCDILSKASYS
jgi:hypothetical protein